MLNRSRSFRYGAALRGILCVALLGVAAASSSRAQSPETVYRIVILDGQNLQQAQRVQSLLQNLDYDPVTLDQQGDSYRVLYGQFPTRGAAEQAMSRLDAEGIEVREVIEVGPAQAARPAPVEVPSARYAVYIAEFTDRRAAEELKQRIESHPAGFQPVAVRTLSDRYFQVFVGNNSLREATALLENLRNAGFTTERISRVMVAPVDLGRPPAPRPTPVLPQQQQPQQPAPTRRGGPTDLSLSPAITQTSLWNDLSEDQKRSVMNEVLLATELRSGDAVAQQVIDIEKRLQSLDDRVRTILDQIETRQQVENKLREQLNRLREEARRAEATGDFNNAIMIYRQMKELDPEDRFGQAMFLDRRIAAHESRIAGETYPGEAADQLKQKTALAEKAKMLSQSDNLGDLNTAKMIWVDIQNLNPERFGGEASTQIETLNQRIDQINETTMAEMREAQGRYLPMLYMLGGALVLVLLLVLLVWMRGRKQHKELIMRIHDITSIRPMRELGGGGAAQIEAAGAGAGAAAGSAADSDVFVPRTPEAKSGVSEETIGDPLGGLADDAFASPPPASAEKKTEVKKEPSPDEMDTFESSSDPLFGWGDTEKEQQTDLPSQASSGAVNPEAQATAAMDFDALFSGESEAPAPEPETKASPAAAAESPEPAAESGESDHQSDLDDVFGNLFGDSTVGLDDESSSGSEPDTAASAQPPSSQDTGPISFGDDSSDADTSDSSTAGSITTPSDSDDLLSIFNTVEDSGGADEPHAVAEAPAPAPAGEESGEVGADDPFSTLLGGDSEATSGVPGSEADTANSALAEEEPGGPGVKLDAAEPDQEVSISNAETDVLNPPSSAATADSISGDSTDDSILSMAGFAFDDQTAIESASGNGAGGVSLDFEDDDVGQPPRNWTGSYDYASLTVQAETPPRGGHQYLCFEKKAGAGKAYYSLRFPDVTGVIGIEFDVRCNDKNKFLLGFYIEKDGDFQRSVHTKILRSEAQTTPTIHMQEESAPYLLGSWAHVKYVVDLNQGKINSYIDNTHVGRDLPLEPNPGMLNTLSIRDNINTTGILLLDNIKVYPIS